MFVRVDFTLQRRNQIPIPVILIALLVFSALGVITLGSQFRSVDAEKCLIWGSGLRPDEIVLPARYFYILAVDTQGQRYEESPALPFIVVIKGRSPHGHQCRIRTDVIDRGDGTSLVRYHLISDWCDKVEIHVHYNGSDVAYSPYFIRNKIHSDKCYCPQDLRIYRLQHKCSLNIQEYPQIVSDLKPFERVNFTEIRYNLIKEYNHPLSISLCHYVIKDQEIWSRCYGKYTGFRICMDATLIALKRLVYLPDMEFFLNLGDWPLSKKQKKKKRHSLSLQMKNSSRSDDEPLFPIFSWSSMEENNYYDIVLPTYDLTKSTIEMMGQISLDIISVQRHQFSWSEKEDKLFWRGRDSRRERLDLVALAKKYPNDLNASITNFFFFQDEIEEYGPTVPHISFMEFFKYKYQLNIDGTVASYRLPYLLAGDGLVFKQDSPYYEHFYRHLEAYKHFVPVKRDLSDLMDKLKWARHNQDLVHVIRQNARKFVEEHLMPEHIYCYHLALFQEWSERLISPVQILPGMEKLESTSVCSCKNFPEVDNEKDEL